MLIIKTFKIVKKKKKALSLAKRIECDLNELDSSKKKIQKLLLSA